MLHDRLVERLCRQRAAALPSEPARDCASSARARSRPRVRRRHEPFAAAAQPTAATRRSTTCSASAITCCRRARAMSQRGVASWYGRDFHGLATSSGETYNMHAMTAAHTTLPLPTWVEVTNLVNGKRVVVKVNDRGPFVDNRLIDLSYAAATALDMVRTGTTRVEVRAVAPPLDACRADARSWPPPPPALTPAPSAARGSIERMFVQIGAFSRAPRTPSGSSRACARAASRIPTVVSEPDDRRTIAPRAGWGPLRDSVEFDAVECAPARDRRVGLAARRGQRAMSSRCAVAAGAPVLALRARRRGRHGSAAQERCRVWPRRRRSASRATISSTSRRTECSSANARRRAASAGEPDEADDGLRRVRRAAVGPHSARRPRARQREGVAHGRHAHVHRGELRGRYRGSAARSA